MFDLFSIFRNLYYLTLFLGGIFIYIHQERRNKDKKRRVVRRFTLMLVQFVGGDFSFHVAEPYSCRDF